MNKIQFFLILRKKEKQITAKKPGFLENPDDQATNNGFNQGVPTE